MYPSTTSSRWCPTPEQLMILEEMYRGGVRTPKAAQIQAITAHLSHYGKIEGKNVFYWFQNHKARDRQKLRRKLMMAKQTHFQHQHQHQQLQNPNQQVHQVLYYIPVEVQPQGGTVNVSPQTVTFARKAEPLTLDFQSLETEKSTTKTDGCDWVVMLDVRPTNKPLKTLELFPTTTTGHGLKNECTTSSIQSISSSTTTH